MCGRNRLPTLHRLIRPFTTRSDTPPILFCPDEWQPLRHLLIVHEGKTAEAQLPSIAALCRSLDCTAVVLTLARSPAQAVRRQQVIQALAAALGLNAEFDSFVGADVPAAVARLAAWRHCQVVLWTRPAQARWRNWIPTEPARPWTSWPASLAVLELPTVGWPERFEPSDSGVTYRIDSGGQNPVYRFLAQRQPCGLSRHR
jgi:hypothetical protein